MSEPLSCELVAAEDDACRATVAATLDRFGAAALGFAAAAGIRVRVLGEGERYRDLSPVLRRLGIDVDSWPAPPAGLFVVEERRVYLRALGAMTVAHEFGHALDCALGGGTYRSAVDPAIRRAYSRAKAFVTPYAASGIDEYFAEAIRAHIGANDEASPWPAATRERLRSVDPEIAKIVSRLFRDELRRFEDHQREDRDDEHRQDRSQHPASICQRV